MAAILTPQTRRRQDRRLVVLLTLSLSLLLVETFLRINGLLPPFVGEAMFAVGVGSGVLGTLALAWNAPAAATDTADVAEEATEVADAQPRRERRTPLVRRPALDL